jgi:CRP-like cAMP-binding protein
MVVQTVATPARPTILIVEDNSIVAKIVAHVVQDLGFAVAGPAARLENGLELLDRYQLQGAIVDIQLDGAQSFPICAELERRSVPFVFITGYDSRIVPPPFRSAPLLTKPFHDEDIRQALERIGRCHRPAGITLRARGNFLLDMLEPHDRALLQEHAEPISLVRGERLQVAGRRPNYVVFPMGGALSVGVTAPEAGVECALVGREGMLGLNAVLQGSAPVEDAIVQFEGPALRIPWDRFAAEVDRNRRMQRHFLRYAESFLEQVVQTAAAAANGSIEQRLARWLLLAADRIGSDALPVIHETLAEVLAVRRPSVTLALHSLEARLLIRSGRGRITILDRAGLMKHAAPFYGRRR